MTTIVYCGVCSLPPEYCEFSGAFRRCKEWLSKNNPELFQKLYSVDALETATSSLSLEKQEELEKKMLKQQAKEEAKAERELQKMMASKVIIRKMERNKRKHAIAILGLEVFEIDLKKLAKTFASKFATGASVTKTPDGHDEIIIQGDVGDAVEAYINKLLDEKGLEGIKVEQIEEKKKKPKPQT